ncbi:hypothetical protein SpCBS45565_g07656 [Spizellomyces sp. 'palustris']|nr:hypothetical protein SpCBS45565_g07656 [Spizellomyces sp. 'palustris']
MRLKLHGSFEALRDSVNASRKVKNSDNISPGLATSKSGSSENVTKPNASPPPRTPALRGLSHKSSNSTPDLGAKQISEPTLGGLDQLPDLGSLGTEGEVHDSLSELQTRGISGGSTRGASSKSGRKVDAPGGSGSGGSLGGIANWTRTLRGNNASRYNVFFKPGFFNTDQALQPSDTLEDVSAGDDLGDEPDSTEDEAITDFKEDSNIPEASPAPSHNTLEVSSTFQVSSLLISPHHESSILTSPIESSTSYNPPTYLGSEDSEVCLRVAGSARGSISHTHGTSTVSSTESLNIAPVSRPSWVSASSLDGTPSASAHGSRVRLDSVSSQTRASSGKRGQDRLPLGPFVASTKRTRELRHRLEGELFAMLDIRQSDWQSTTTVEDDETAVLVPGIALPLRDLESTVTMENCDGRSRVASATLPDLVRLLALEGANDAEYLTDFLNTYRYFADPRDVARLLAMRYIEISESVSEQETFSDLLSFIKTDPVDTRPDWAGFVQLRILNVFKKWIDGHAGDFDQHGELYQFVETFLVEYVKRDAKRVPFADAMLKNLEEKVSGIRSVTLMGAKSEPLLFSTERRSSSGSIEQRLRRPSAPGPAAAATLSRTLSPLTLDFTVRTRGVSATGQSGSPTSATSHGRSASAPPMPSTVDPDTALQPALPALWDYDPDTIAQQLTLLEHTQFKRIRPSEFFFQSWNDRHLKDQASPNLSILIGWFNRVAYGVATEVVLGPKIKSRVTTLKRFIYIAQVCFRWNNYNTLFEIVAGLNLGPVTRLKKTWKALPKKYWDVWNQLNQIVSNEGSYRTYRTSLRTTTQKSSTCPILPYLGVNLSDLTFAEDGNPTLIQSANPQPPVINFTKFRLVSSLVQSVSQLQRGEYTFPVDENAQAFLRNEWIVLDDAELYEASRTAEPRMPST